MKKIPKQSAFFNLRVISAAFICLLGASLGFLSIAGTPSTGTLSPSTPVLTYDAGPFNTPNQSPVGLGQLDSGPRCDGGGFPCDSYALTVSLPSGYVAAHPNSGLKVTMFWTDTGSGQSDYDVYVYNGVVGDLGGNQPANHQGTAGSDPEIAVVNPLVDGTSQYTIKIVPFVPTHETVHVRIELLPGSGPGPNPNFGGADPTAPGVPRYHIFEAPAGSSADSSQGEFNIGFNPATGRIMVMNSGPIWRLTPPEKLAPALPECCEALWEDRSANTTNTGLDPILWTDQLTGRTFASNSTAGANAVYAYSDSDGEPTVTQPTGWTEFGVGAPNGGADHETLGSGPYPNIAPFNLPGGLGSPTNPVTHGHAVYYCSQDIVGPAACYRSDTLGSTWGASTLAYNGTTTACGGLHGHVHVAPDGTVWLPVNQCNGQQGGALSTDGGTTWTEFIVPNAISQSAGADPSIAIDSDSNVYYAYVNNEPVGAGNPPEGHARVAKGHRNANNTVTWTNFFDLGASHGLKNAVEIEAVGGSSGRAAVAFLGTNINGDYQALTFPGKWYAFIATTYDSGQTWNTVNATPNDPVQSATGVWQQGGGQLQRNLLDFTEITIDDKGGVLYGYSDGCVKPECIGGGAPNDFVAHMRVARQSGGKSLFSSFDAQTDTTAAKLPKPACLSGFRDPLASHLSWKIPDNGGVDIQKYEIWRGTAPGNEVKIFTTLNPDPKYTDLNPPANQHLYYYVKAINSVGTGTPSNEIDLVGILPPAPTSACVVPGLTELVDPAGDTSATLVGIVNTPAPPGTDLLSFQLAQPFQNDGIPRLVFTINTDPNPTGTGVTGSATYVAMKIVKGAATTYAGVHLTWNDPSTAVLESYVPGASNGGVVDGRFVEDGSQKPAEPGSNYAAALGKITIIVKASDLGLNPSDTIAGFVAGTSQTVGGQITGLYDQMPDSLSFANSYPVNFNNICGPQSPGVVSRKIHGASGPFDIALAQAPNPTAIESRGSTSSNAYTLVYTFGANLSFAGGATVTQGAATVGAPFIGPNLNQVTIPLTNVANLQHLAVTLSGVQDAAHTVLGAQIGRMDVLVGDVNQSRHVDSGDLGAVQRQNSQAATGSNFRMDPNASGHIDAADVAIIQRMNSTGLQP
ncbi:MAG TPA: hypothetical protein VGM62_11510 [Chthoniobacterales bacterium]